MPGLFGNCSVNINISMNQPALKSSVEDELVYSDVNLTLYQHALKSSVEDEFVMSTGIVVTDLFLSPGKVSVCHLVMVVLLILNCG